jgi:hypothetical protein
VSAPVWIYWEGAMPPWIARCIESIRRHAPDLHALDPAGFAELYDGDAHLGDLHVAQRADYIRAYLLARYGGLWVDCDCVVMRTLGPVLDLAEEYGFVGHFERQGRISNAFIASRPGGRIARAHFDRVHALVTSGRPLDWLTLGAASLMEVLRDTGEPWHRLPVERVQPICWSEPAAFFVRGSAAEHAARVDPAAYCYMLSQNTVDGHARAAPGADLMAEDTFFRYLVDVASHPVEKASEPGPPATGAAPELLSFCLRALTDAAPGRVLDLAPADGRWGLLARGAGGAAVEAVLPAPAGTSDRRAALYDVVHVADPLEFIAAAEGPRWDVVVVDDTAIPPDPWQRLLAAALRRADYVVAACAVGSEAATASRVSDLLAPTPVRTAVHRDGAGEHAAALYSRTDPRGLRTRPATESLFSRIFRDNGWLEAESRSGPGSGLVQTAVLRAELPGLLRSLGARSLLDVPCGDFNWLRHVDLGDVQYVGADIVDDLVARDRLAFGCGSRRFVTLDMTGDPLPHADVVLCRDGLVHLSFEDGLRALANFRRTGARHLVATTFPTLDVNEHIETGGWRPLNLQRPPFLLPEPVTLLNEGCTEGQGSYADKSLGVWEMSDLLC